MFVQTQEVGAVSTISQRGVSLVGTAHGHDLHSIMQNPVLMSLVGGIEVRSHCSNFLMFMQVGLLASQHDACA